MDPGRAPVVILNQREECSTVSADMVAEAEQPAAAMLDRIVGYWVSCAVHVAAKLGLADQLSDGPRTVEDLASATGSHASPAPRIPSLSARTDFSGIATLVDIGGGHGSLVAEILRATPGLRGVVYDRPEVIEAAERELHGREPGIADRYELIAGDFFESVPKADAFCRRPAL